jgi:hypothetical protein
MCPRRRLEIYKVVFRVNNIRCINIGLILKRHEFIAENLRKTNNIKFE